MGLRRTSRLTVRQREELTDDGEAVFWFVVKGRNGHITVVSETFPTRSNAKRAARRFIDEIAPVPVTFEYWTGPVPPRGGEGYRRVTEQIR